METSLTGKALDLGLTSMGSNPLFPKNIKDNRYAYVLSQLNMNIAKRKLFVDLYITKKGLRLIELLEKLNLIKSFYKINKTIFRINFLYTRNYKLKRSLFLYLRKGDSLHLTLKSIKILNLNMRFSYLLLETDKGLLTHKEAIYHKVGGRLLLSVL